LSFVLRTTLAAFGSVIIRIALSAGRKEFVLFVQSIEQTLGALLYALCNELIHNSQFGILN